MKPFDGICPETMSRGGLLVKVPSDDLIGIMDAPLTVNDGRRKLKALALMELLYRAGIRTQEAYQCAWIAIFGDIVEPSAILRRPAK